MSADGRGPTQVKPSLLASLTLLALVKHRVKCDMTDIRIVEEPAQGQVVAHSVHVHLSSDALNDALRDGADVARMIHENLSPFCATHSVRVTFS